MSVKCQLQLKKRMEKDSNFQSHLLSEPTLVKTKNVNGWYVKFYAFSVDSEEKQRFRIRVKGGSETERINDAKIIIKTIKDAFKNGAYISKVKRKDDTSTLPMADKITFKSSFEKYYNFVIQKLKPRSKETYKTWYNTVLSFFQEKGWDTFLISSIQKRHIRAFFDFLVERKGLSNKSYNDFIGFLSGFYNYMIDRGTVEVNLVKGFIKRLKVISGKHTPYTPQQAKSILNYFDSQNDQLSKVFLQFCYYTLARPREELRNLKVGDIGIDTIFFRPANAKSTETSYIVIPKPLEEILQEYKIRDYPSDYYIFSSNENSTFLPGPKPTYHKFFYLRIRKALKVLGLTDKDYDLYSWKHTAVCQLFIAGVDIESIRQQCRHSDVKQTIQYLKDLGMIRNSEVKDKFPEI